jgi:hypothetical protein
MEPSGELSKEVYYLKYDDIDKFPEDYDLIKWTYHYNGEIIYSQAFKELIGYNLFVN